MRDFLQEAAWRFILDEGIKSLPVHPIAIINRHGWKLYTYHDFAKQVHKSVAALMDEYDKEGFVFWSYRDQTFVICYNSDFPADAIRWTLMHEIAHIVLKHVSPRIPALPRIKTNEKPLFEVEAQGFARRVLCPSIILHACKAFSPHDIMQLCGVSYEVAKQRSDYIKALEVRGKFRSNPLEKAVEKQFQLFILRWFVAKGRYRCEIAQECHVEISA